MKGLLEKVKNCAKKCKDKLANINFSFKKLDEETKERLKQEKAEKAEIKKQEKEVKKLIKKNTKFQFVKKFIAVILIASMILPSVYGALIYLEHTH